MEKKMANFIWLIRAVQLFADNCFKLFFIYIYYMATIVHMF